MSASFVDEAGHDLSEVRPETLPGAVDTFELLDSAVTALGGQRREGQRFMAAKVAEASAAATARRPQLSPQPSPSRAT